MDYLFHQIIVFIVMMIYVPVSMAYIISISKEKGWLNRICCMAMSSCLIVNLPYVIKNYQQYLMGHFSGLPEVITKGQLIVNTVIMIVLILVIISYIYVKIRMRSTFYNGRHKKYMLEY